MKNKLTHNLGLKIAAVFVALLLWLINVNINNPLITSSYTNLPVQLVNTYSITGQNKVYKVLDNSDSVTVMLRAPREVLQNISREQFVIRADCAQLTEENLVPIEFSLNDKSLENKMESIRMDKSYVHLQVEDQKTRQLGIQVEKTGKLPDGYVAGRSVTETNMMSITGPESVIATVAKAVVEVSMDSVTSNVEIVARIRLRDADGNEITSSDIQKSIQDVKVTVPVYPTKEVPVRYSSSGTVASGYALTRLEPSIPETVTVAGKESLLSQLEYIEIPDTELDVTDATEDVTVTVDVRKYLPADVTVAGENFDGRVTLTARIEPILRRTYEIPADEVQILNIPEHWLAELLPDQKLEVTVTGLQEDLSVIDREGLTPHTDVSTLQEEDGSYASGEHTIEIKVLLPEGVRQEDTVTARLRLVRIAQEE